ncbi:ABC transporter permease [Leifsonia aquatica]|uniref:Peptide/nickel transport system permease protein n=2 Tax=Leifsonia aquatica TaxID=144185 RepID=A0A7W4UXZ8_LEIAQ|nr:ABC transporter permease [Leifsonia aquatica]ERK72242.1 putative glutathione ABC transporter, permease protein GsiC [Leifsonia aquatica ATCC 14665]MBB2968314.1 peptide/nickel transport system permease protein [Leifsonia aquatica]
MAQLVRLAGRRLIALPFMILGITLLVFLVLQLAPTDPATNALGESASDAAKAAWRQDNGYNDPLIVRYLGFLGHLFQGNLGNTVPPAQPVGSLIATAFPLTLQLTFLGLIIAVVVAAILGVVAALYRDRWPDQVIRVVSIAGIAVPSFWLAILLIQQFALTWPIFPTGGYTSPQDSFTGWLQSMFLPAVALAVPVAASLTRVVRTSMVEELDRDYVRTAIGSGLPRTVVIGRNVFRNALITPITVLGLRVGYLLGGAIVIEVIFDLPGMGQLILGGVTAGDTNLVQGVTITIALTFVIVNTIVDLLYLVVNPRIRTV